MRGALVLALAACAAALVLTIAPLPAVAQEIPAASRPDSTSDERLKVFVDCSGFFCDFDFLRTEIGFVDYVRDRQVADVHVLATTQRTAAGGTEYTVAFIGLRAFAGTSDTLRHVSGPADSQDTERRALARVIALGLVRYAARSAGAERIRVSLDTASTSTPARAAARDPWNLWVFRSQANGNVNGEKSSKSTSLFENFSANRTTEMWKVRLALNGQYGESKFVFNDSSTFNSYSHSYGATALVVRSLGAHWSAGGNASASASSFANYRAAVRVAPALEYDVFPYAQSTRRLLALRYSVGFIGNRYEDTTIYGKISEALVDQQLIVSLDAKQPWGSVSISVDGANYLHDFRKNHLETFVNGDLRLYKGLSLNGFVSASLVHDQISLRVEGATNEEILVRQRELATQYRYFAFVGLSYTFGSIFNNVVNPRFGGSSGGTFFMF
ncbi:MAG: hypothetical protein M3068_05505 [Gemmatimonadota bacterium]|nr:hypothetical protein [Gemmatimonadota bacterium]